MKLYMRFPKGKTKALTLSYDDGVQQDIRLIEIMNKYGLKGTFNINSGLFAAEDTVYKSDAIQRRMTLSECISLYTNSNQEVAIHTLTHAFLDKLPLHNTIYELETDKKNLEEIFSFIIRGGAYPFGTYNEETVEALKMCGIEYFRTTESTESFDMPENWLMLHPTCHHQNPRLNELTEKFINEEPPVTGPQRFCPWLFYLWGHSYEFEMNDNWELIEKFAAKLGGKDDIWYATNIEIVDYHKAYKSLIFSADLSMVKNPTCTDVWIFEAVENKTYKIAAGETIRLK